MGIITLTTDFGLEDSYVAEMKGVILSICPDATLVDITHYVPPQDIRGGAFVLSAATRTFPPGAVHLAVVGPGRGHRSDVPSRCRPTAGSTLRLTTGCCPWCWRKSRPDAPSCWPTRPTTASR